MSNTVSVTLTGNLPMLMHNERLANPLDPAALKLKSLTGKRKKTQDDIEAISFAEFEGGLYHDEKIGPYIPVNWVLATLREAGRLSKQGKDVIRGLFLVDTKIPLKYKGPRDIEGLWKAGYYDRRMVGNQKNRVLRTRPRFNEWGVEFDIEYDLTVFDHGQVLRLMESGGRSIGLGDYRPMFGRFGVKEIQQ